jgi:hypothetical protein
MRFRSPLSGPPASLAFAVVEDQGGRLVITAGDDRAIVKHVVSSEN